MIPPVPWNFLENSAAQRPPPRVENFSKNFGRFRMQRLWIILLVLGAVANFYIAWLAFQDGAMGQVAIAIALALLCAGVAYLRLNQGEKR